MSWWRGLATLFLAVAATRPALAHELGLVQVETTFKRDGTYVVDFAVDREHLPPQASSPESFLHVIAESAVMAFDGKRAGGEQEELVKEAGEKRSVARLRLTGHTPPAVTRFTFEDAAIPGYFVLTLVSEGQGEKVTQWVEGGQASAPFTLDRAVVPQSRSTIVQLYLRLGFTHILPRGLDHVLFVLGIFFLAAQFRSVLWQVSAFTMAHTITLALSVYGVVSLPSRIVEPLIALSIVYVAVENVLTARLHAWRPVVVFGFGLLHGMGFAGVLAEIGLPSSELVPALLAFNLGVECGQLTVIFAAFLLLALPFRQKPWSRHRIVIPGSLAIAAVGLYWSVQRLFFPG